MPEQAVPNPNEMTIPPDGRVLILSDPHLKHSVIHALGDGPDSAVLRAEHPWLVDLFKTRPAHYSPLTVVLNGDITQLPCPYMPAFNDFLLNRKAAGMDIRIMDSNHAPFSDWPDIEKLIEAGIAVTGRSFSVRTLFGQRFQIEHGHEIVPLRHVGQHNPVLMKLLNGLGAGMHAFDSILHPNLTNLWVTIARELLLRRYANYAAENLGLDEYLVAGHIHYPAQNGNVFSTGMLGREKTLFNGKKQMLSTLLLTNVSAQLRAFAVDPERYGQMPGNIGRSGNPMTALHHPTHKILGTTYF